MRLQCPREEMRPKLASQRRETVLSFSSFRAGSTGGVTTTFEFRPNLRFLTISCDRKVKHMTADALNEHMFAPEPPC
jgi:hypothetical protein